MRRYFYKTHGIMERWLQLNANLKRQQDEIYMNAFFSKLGNGDTYSSIRQQIMNYTMKEQHKIANNHHLQLIYNHFIALHRVSQGKRVLYNAYNTQVKDLVNPDMFPIWDLKCKNIKYLSLWDNTRPQLRNQLGFQLRIGQSRIRHPASGRGVYVITEANKKYLEVGSFLGFVPGIVYKDLLTYKHMRLNNLSPIQPVPQHLHFPSNTILQLTQIRYNNQKSTCLRGNDHERIGIDPSLMNPYAVGHMINHPPPNTQPNVCFLQMDLQLQFLPQYIRQKYLPYEQHIEKGKNLILYGIFALKQLKSGQQLYVDYTQSHIHQINNIPEWLIEPPKQSEIFQYLNKQEYETVQSGYFAYFQQKALAQNEQLLKNYQRHIIRKPSTTIYEDDSQIIKKM